MKGMWGEFKAFALGGNMLDLALGFIIGTAFATVVDSLAGDVIMQFVAAVAGQPDFTQLVWTLNGAEIRYGAFITVIVNFLLLALVLFGLVKLLKKVGLGNFRAQGSHECPSARSSWRSTRRSASGAPRTSSRAQADDEDAVEITTQQRIAE